MEIKVEFCLLYNGREKKYKMELDNKLHELEIYRKKEQFIGNNIYKINQNLNLYKNIVDYCEKRKQIIEYVNLGFEIKVTDEERKRAVAFIPMFPDYYCEEYDDITYEFEECDFCYCKRRTDELFYVQPKGYIKKHFNDYGMAGIDVAGGGILLLPNLVNELINEGVDKKFFQPVLNKRKKIMGYTYISQNILPETALKDRNYIYLGKCPVCGAVKLKKKENQYYFQAKTMNEDALKYLQDVNLTYEFYDEYREIVVSKKVENLVNKYVKYAEFIPVFLK